MKWTNSNKKCALRALAATAICVLGGTVPARAVTTGFFTSSQTTNFVSADTTSDTISSEGYLFTCTRDKLFTGGYGLTNPVGRYVRVFWPDGLESQAVTAGPNPSGAKLTIRREDGQPFAITSFTFKLLANTGGAGAAIEVMPKVNGEDAAPDPFMYQATGYYGQNFTHNSPQLTNADSYTFSLYVDFALMNFMAVDASAPVMPDNTGYHVKSVSDLTPTSATVNCAGVAGYGYVIERTTNLIHWTRIGTNTAPANGLFTVQDNFSDCGGIRPGLGFYRLTPSY